MDVSYWLYWQNQIVATVRGKRDLTDHEVRILALKRHLDNPPSEDAAASLIRERKIIAADVRLAA